MSTQPESMHPQIADPDPEPQAAANPPAPSTDPPGPHHQETLDAALALALHEDEVEALHAEHHDVSALLADATHDRLVPRVNPSHPSTTLYRPHSAARERLEVRLDMYALAERPIAGDGNCQFASLSDQLYATPALQQLVRDRVVWQLRETPERYREYVPERYEAYCKAMERSGTWGDHVTLQAAADFFRLRICLVTSFEETCIIEVEPAGGAPGNRTLWLSFWAEVHYNSINPAGEPPLSPPEFLKRKLLGSVKLHRLVFGET